MHLTSGPSSPYLWYGSVLPMREQESLFFSKEIWERRLQIQLFELCENSIARMISILTQVSVTVLIMLLSSLCFHLHFEWNCLILQWICGKFWLWKTQERLLGAALGTVVASVMVFEQRKSIYKSIAEHQSRFSPQSQVGCSLLDSAWCSFLWYLASKIDVV